MKKILIAIFCVFVLLAGCTQSGETNTDNSTGENAINNAQVGTEVNVEDVFAQFLNSASQNPTYMAKYEISAPGNDSQLGAMEYTLYSKGNIRRTDVSMMGINAQTWILTDRTVTCSEMEGFMEKTCEESESTGEPVNTMNIDKEEFEANKDNYKAYSLPSKTIGGETANCFSIEMISEEMTAEYCFSSDGILLYSKGITEDGEFEMKATEFSRNVSDADMTPPEVE